MLLVEQTKESRIFCQEISSIGIPSRFLSFIASKLPLAKKQHLIMIMRYGRVFYFRDKPVHFSFKLDNRNLRGHIYGFYQHSLTLCTGNRPCQVQSSAQSVYRYVYPISLVGSEGEQEPTRLPELVKSLTRKVMALNSGSQPITNPREKRVPHNI